MKKLFYKKVLRLERLVPGAKRAKIDLKRLCDLLSFEGKRKFELEMKCSSDVFEGHIIDAGLAEDGEPCGMIFFGGFFYRKRRGKRRNYGLRALGNAYVSLLEDCLGLGELGKNHTLTDHLKDYGPKLDLNFETALAFEKWLNARINEFKKNENDNII